MPHAAAEAEHLELVRGRAVGYIQDDVGTEVLARGSGDFVGPFDPRVFWRQLGERF